MIGEKVEFVVDNYSGDILVSDFDKELKTRAPHWSTGEKKEYIVPPNKSGVYILWSEIVTPIYIGKATNLRGRLNEHLFLVDDEYDEFDRFSSAWEWSWHKAKQIESKSFSFILCDTPVNGFLEQHLIKKHTPKYNRQHNQKSLSDKEYDYTLFNDIYNPLREVERNAVWGHFYELSRQ